VFVANAHDVARDDAARVFTDAVVLALLSVWRQEYALDALDLAVLV